MIKLLNEVVRRTRQHHAIEHATIHLLSQRSGRADNHSSKRGPYSGISDPLGFTIYGASSTEEVRRAVGDALLRLQAGENQLALHPNCGTNLVTTGILVTLMALITGRGKGSLWQRTSVALPFVLATLLFSKPLGLRLQAYTTLAEVGDRWVVAVQEVQIGTVRAFRVDFE